MKNRNFHRSLSSVDRPSPEYSLDPREVPAIVNRMMSIVGWGIWQKRIESLNAEMGINPLWKDFVLERHGFEMALNEIRKYFRLTGRYPWPPRTAEQYRLYSFFATATRVFDYLEEKGRGKFSGAIKSGLDRECGLGPIAYEMAMVANLWSRGYEVKFNDLQDGHGFDFLVISPDCDFEMECKYISADIGRQIHRQKLHRMGRFLFPIISRDLDMLQGGCFVQVTLKDRLTGNHEGQEHIARSIGNIILGGERFLESDEFIVENKVFNINNTPFDLRKYDRLDKEMIRKFAEENFGADNAHLCMACRPGQNAIMVHFRSAKPDRVLDTMFKKLKSDANKQFSHNKPGFLCVHLSDLDEKQLLEIAELERSGEETGIQRAANVLLHIRPHLHTVAITTDGDVCLETQYARSGKTVSLYEKGPSYVFRNQNHPLTKSESLSRVFG